MIDYQHDRPQRLPHRHLVVMCLLAKGMSLKQIGVMLNIKRGTVHNYIKDVKLILGAETRDEAMAIFTVYIVTEIIGNDKIALLNNLFDV